MWIFEPAPFQVDLVFDGYSFAVVKVDWFWLQTVPIWLCFWLLIQWWKIWLTFLVLLLFVFSTKVTLLYFCIIQSLKCTSSLTLFAYHSFTFPYSSYFPAFIGICSPIAFSFATISLPATLVFLADPHSLRLVHWTHPF